MARATKYTDLSTRIGGVLAEAKLRNGMTDEDLGEAIGYGKDLIRKRRSDRTLPELRFSAVWHAAELAGYRIRIERIEE